MKFLIDACAGGRITAWLAQLGHDVLEVRGIDKAMPDIDVIEWAINDGRTLLQLIRILEKFFLPRDITGAVLYVFRSPF